MCLYRLPVVLALSAAVFLSQSVRAAKDEPEWPSGFSPNRCEVRLTEKIGQFNRLNLKNKIRRVHELAETAFQAKMLSARLEQLPALALRLKEVAQTEPRKLSRYTDELVIIAIKVGSFAPSAPHFSLETVQNICRFLESIARLIQDDATQNPYATVIWGSNAYLNVAKLGEAQDPKKDLMRTAFALEQAYALAEDDSPVFPTLFAIRMIGEHAKRFSQEQIAEIDDLFANVSAEIERHIPEMVNTNASTQDFRTFTNLLEVIDDTLPYAKSLVKTHKQLELIVARFRPAASRN